MSLIHDTHLMVDIETLGKGPDSIILSLGAVTFIPAGEFALEDSIYYELNAELQNRTVEIDTVRWWMKQETAAPINGDVLLQDALIRLNNFIAEYKPKHFWANGSSFDFPILTHAYLAAGISIPWGYSDIKDYRTMRKLFRHVPMIQKNPNEHHALDDAKYQAMHLSAILVNLDGMIKDYEKDGK